MKHRASRLAWILLILLSSLPAWGQEEPARFLIERITVEGTKEAAANIVRSETLLRAGESYSEGQLRQAVYRVHRLPFVLDASFSLRKGSRRGAYELVIEVRPARWFFYDLWFRGFAFDQPLDLEGNEAFRGYRSSASVGSVAGVRRFVGRSGVLFAALDSEEGIQAGFTQYDLLHRGILASVGISRNECCVTEVLPLALDPTFSAWTFDTSLKVSLGISIPLSGPQSFQITASERRGERGSRNEVLVGPGLRENPRSGGGEELSYRRAEAKWVWDTSDDPLFPTRGLSVSAGLEASRFAARDLDLTQNPLAPEPIIFFYPTYRSEQVVGAVSVIRHWALTPRQTVSLMGRVSAGRSRLDDLAVKDRVLSHVDAEYYAGSAGVEHAWTLRRSRVAGELSDLRLESGVEIGGERTHPDLGPSPLKRFSAHTGFVYRNPWGRIRLTFTYLDFHEVVR